MITLNEKLVNYLLENQRIPFRFGSQDCGLFTTRWVDRIVGSNYTQRLEFLSKGSGLAKLRGRIAMNGGYQQIVEEFCGVTGKPGKGELGDVVIFAQLDGSTTLGIQSVRLIHIPGEEGLVSVDSNRALVHWSLECLRQ